MPTVRRPEGTTVGIEALRGGQKRAASTALSEGAGVSEATAQKFGAIAQVGERIARIGADAYGRMLHEERQRADQTALLSASNKLAEWKNRRLYDPEKGALALKGQAALQLPEDVRDEFEQVASGIESTLTNPEQRTAFARLRAQEFDAVDLQVRRHVFGEAQAYRAQELKAHVENQVNAAMAVATDPKLVQVELQKATSAIERNAPTLGLGPEAVEAQVREVTSRTHLGVISQLLAKDQERAAADYFAATRGQIDAGKLDEVERALEEGTLRKEGQQRADAIVTAGGTLTQQREKARAIEDPKLRDQVMQRVEHEGALAEREKTEREQTNQRRAYDIVDKTNDVTRIPADLWTSLEGSTRAGLHAYAKARLKGVDVETDLPTYYALMQRAASEPTGFAGENLLQYRAKLGETEFKQLAGLQLSIKAGDQRAAEKEVAPFQTRGQLVDDTLTLHGINPAAKPDTAEGKAIAQLRRMVDLRVGVLQADGKKASNQDIQAEIDGILSTSIETPGSWWNVFPGGKAGPWSVDKKRIIDLTPADIPPAERPRIEQALRSRNRPVSDATVLDLYIETQIHLQRRGTQAGR